MPARSFYYGLPLEKRQALNNSLIKNGFGKLTEIADWLKSEGHTVSKSALHRYSADLQAKHQVAGKLAENVNLPVEESGQGEACDLLMELGALRVRETRIINRLTEIGFV